MNIAAICSKTIGIVSAGLIMYDAHKNGQIMSTMNAKQNIADTMVDQYIQSNNISKLSTVEANTKKAWFRFVMDNNIKEPIDSTIGYVKGFLESVVNDIIPAVFATGAIVFGGKKLPTVGKLCSLGLIAYGLKYMLFDIMSLGKRDYLKEKV